MICAANKCSQGREPCTRTECGYMPIVLLDKAPANCVERWARWGFVALVIAVAAWWLCANWPMLRWALN